MKYFGPVFIVVALLLSAAVYYNLTLPPAPTGLPNPYATPSTPTTTEHISAPTVLADVPTTSATSASVLTLDAALSHGYLAPGDNGNNLYSSIDITAADLKGMERPAVNVALVIDRSGSMEGLPMIDAKKAAQNFVERLGNGDTLSVISFSDNVRVDFPSSVVTASNRHVIRGAIERIYADGGTNISGGFEAGVQEILRSRSERSINRIILLTDGMPNYGMTSTPQLVELARRHQREGMTLTAIGFGLQYNEDLMAAMADAGAGNYYYAKDREAVAAAFTTEFQQLNTIIARQTMLRMELGQGVRVAEVFGYPFEQNGQIVEIPLGEFYGGQNKNILMHLHTSASAMGLLPVADIRLDYEDRVKEIGVTQQVSLSAVVTEDSKLQETMLNTKVLTRVEEVQIAQSVQVAMTQYSEGRAEDAKKTLREQTQRTAVARKRFNLPEAKFQAASAEIENNIVFYDTVPASSPAAKSAVKQSKASGRSVRMSTNAGW